MKTTICDICKNPIDTLKTKIKIKREYITIDGFRFFDKFDLCENCKYYRKVSCINGTETDYMCVKYLDATKKAIDGCINFELKKDINTGECK